MNETKKLQIISICMSMVLLLTMSASGQVSPGVENILMIVIDDLRPEIGAYAGTNDVLFQGKT